jgi:hypothetical protein
MSSARGVGVPRGVAVRRGERARAGRRQAGEAGEAGQADAEAAGAAHSHPDGRTGAHADTARADDITGADAGAIVVGA